MEASCERDLDRVWRLNRKYAEKPSKVRQDPNLETSNEIWGQNKGCMDLGEPRSWDPTGILVTA